MKKLILTIKLITEVKEKKERKGMRRTERYVYNIDDHARKARDEYKI
jgi:hypothetical protein